MNNKNIFASNLKRYMEMNRKTRREVSAAIGVSYYTFTDWVNGKKYPRMDKVEKLAQYFGILKSDLIEDKEKKPTIPEDDGLTEAQRNAIALVKKMDEQTLTRFVAAAKAMLGED